MGFQRIDETNNTNSQSRMSTPYTPGSAAIVTTTSGKQYSLGRDEMNWIQNRYKQDSASTYGLDVADQQAKANGQLSAKMLSTYGNSNVDRQLAQLGLPSEKNLEKYLGEYQAWHTGGMDQYFSQMNLPKNYWTNVKGWYQSDMQNAYENTAEDQQRKAKGLMPSKWESKYTDTEIDDQLRARGLPPISEFNTYANRWNNYTGIENFYANVALADTNLRLQGVNDDDKEYEIKDPQTGEVKTGIGKDLYAESFFNELKKTNEDGSYVYAPIMSMFQNRAKPSSGTPSGDYAYDLGAEIVAANKEAASDEDYANYNAFSYDDYKSKADGYYDKYWKDAMLANGQKVSDALAIRERDANEAAVKGYYAVDGPKEAVALAAQYRKDYPDNSYEQMFLDMKANAVSDQDAYTAMRSIQKEAEKNNGKGGYFDVSNAFAKVYGGVWSNVSNSDAPIPDVAKPLTDEQRDAQHEADLVKAAQQYSRAVMNGDSEALTIANDRAKFLGYDSPEAMTAALKEDRSENFAQAVRDALAVYDSAMVAYKDAANTGVPQATAHEPVDKALKALNALGFKSNYDAQRYVGGSRKANPQEFVKKQGNMMDNAIDAKLKAGEEDTKTIDATRTAIEDALFGEDNAPANVKLDAASALAVEYDDALIRQDRDALYDLTQDIRDLGFNTREELGDWLMGTKSSKKEVNPLNLDVDGVIKILDAVSAENWTNPTAMRIALQDLGFIGDDFSGVADDLTALWSEEDKNKLAFYLGGSKLTGRAYEDVIPGFNRAGGDTIGDAWADTGEAPDRQKNDTERFPLALEWVQEQIAAGNMTEEDGYQLLAAKGYQNEMETYMPEEWHRAHFAENKAPVLYAQEAGPTATPWEELSVEAQRGFAQSKWNALSDEEKAAMYRDGWWEYDQSVYRTHGQALSQQIRGILPGFITELVKTPISVADAIGANITGRPEMWETTHNLMAVQEGITRLGAVSDNVNGAKVAAMAADAVQELLRMEVYGSVGIALGESFVGGTKLGGVIAKVAESTTSPKVVRKAADLFLGSVRSSPYMVSSFASNYTELKALGASNGEAAWNALKLALVEGGLEGANFDGLWGRLLGQKNFASQLIYGANTYMDRLGIIGKSWIANAAISGLGEWTEESIGYVYETYLKRKHLDTWGKGTEWSTEDWLQQAMMGFITGALGGGIHSVGSFVYDGVTLSKALRDNPQLQQQLPDVLASIGVAGSVPEPVLETYRKGGAKIMSLDEMKNISAQDESYLGAIQSAYTSMNDEKAKRKSEYDTRVNEINATVSSAVGANINDSAKLSEFVNKCKKLGISIDFDSIWNTDPQTWDAQIRAQAQAAKQNALDNAKTEYESSLKDLDTDFANRVSTNRDNLYANAKKTQEHFIGLFLQNENLLNSMSEEMLTNLSKAYMEGAKYEPESKAQTDAENPSARAAEAVAGENPVDPDNIPWFSKKSKLKAQGAESRPFTDADAQKVKDVAKALKYKGGITFVDEPDANWQGSITKSNGNIVINKAKLSANDIQKLQSNPAMWVLEHELVHYMGEHGTAAYGKFRDAVVSMLKNSPYIKGNDSAYNAVLDGMIKSREEQGLGTLTRVQAEEELVANFAMEYLFDSEDAIRSLFQTNGSVGQQILSWLRYKINQAKLRRSKESWARDILDIERMYAKAYRETRGKTQSTESTNNKAFSAASALPSYDYSKSLEEIYQDYKDHKMPTDSPIVVGGVGGALRQIGLSRLPVFMNPTHVRYVTNDNAYAASHPNTTEDSRLNHAFTKEEFAKLRSELEDPIAVIAYPNDKDKTINVLTSMRSKNGRLAVVALHLDSNTRINGVQNVEGYDVKTIHGRDNYWSLLRNALESDSESNPQVFYLNFDKMKSELSKENSEIKNEVLALSKAKEKASATGRDGQYSSDRPAVGAFIRSIPDAGYRVNTKSQLETKQFQNWFNGSRAKNEDGTPIEFWRTSDGTYTTDRNAADGDETYYLSVKQPYKGDLYITRIKYGSLKDAAIDLSRKGYDSFLTEDANGDAAYIVFRKGQAKLADDANIGLFDKTIKNAAYSGEGESLDWLGEESQDEEDPYADWEPTDDDVYDPWGALAADVYGPQGGFSRERVHAPKDTGVSEKFRPRDDDDVGKKLTRTGDEYSRRNWTPRPPSYMVVDGEFVGRDNLDTGVTAADDEAYMQAAMNGDYLKALEMKDAVARRINAMTIAHGEERGYAYDSINYGRDFGGNPNYFGSTDINTAQTYADNPDVGRHVRQFRVAPNEFDLIEEQLQIARMFLSKDINLGLDLSYVLEDNLVEPGEPVLMFADSELTPEQASELEEYPMRPVYRVYDKDTGEVLARTYPVSRGRGTTTDAIKMLNDLADKLGIPRGRLLESSPLTGGVQMDYAMPGDQNTYEGSSAFWDEVPTAHDENAQPVDVQFLEEDGGTHMYVVDQETGEVLHDKKFDGYGPEALTHLKQLDVQRAFDEWYGPGEDLWKFATYNAKPLDASSDDMYTRGMMVYNLYDSDESMPAFVENVPDWNRATTDEIGRADYGEGFDATLIKNISDASDSFGRNTITDVYMGHNPNLIKSASPIELKRNGEIIPLSEMFNDARNDKRYSASGESVEDLLRKYGAIEQGREPRARDVEVPKQTNDNNRVSQWIRSLIESGKLTDDQAQNVLRMVVEQDYGTYVPTSQAERMEEARAYIAERQPLQAQQEFHDMVMQGKFGVKTNALGIQLLSDASARGDIASVLDIASDLQLAATEAGQSAQIFNVLKELKGVGSAWYMQKVIDRMNAKYADRIKAGKMNRISVDPALMAELAKATTVDQMAAAEEAVAKDIARQLPLTWDDRLSSWRYFSMLANPTTHIRNITGNLLMKVLNTAKDVTAIGVQRVAEKLGLASESDRAHAWLTSADKSTWGNWVQRSYEEQARNLSGGSKLGFESFVKQNMRSFDNKIANALAQFNFKALENEDIAFIKPAYKNALMQYMVAQGYTLNEKGQAGKVDAKGEFHEMTKAQMNEAIDWASQQAWKQTFRDASSLATMLNKLSKENAVSRLLVEGVMPFKKTPINIARRGVDYSPAGIIKGIAQLTNGVKKGKVTTAQAIDTLASGITGSALMALGVMLAKLGVIRAGGEKDKKLETYLEDTGDQTYAVKIGDKSINMSAIAPATIPLFMGVALNEMIEQGGDTLDLSTITDTIAGTLNPFMEMSFMASLNSALQNYNQNGIGGALGNTLLTAAQNYGSQFLPTLGGKIAQFLDPTRRTTKSDITSPIGSNMDYYARSLAKKVPGLESTLQPDVDVWGRTDTKDSFGDWALDFANKFILPTNIKVTNRDAVDNELIRVVESTGVTDFLPSDGNKYFIVNKQRYEMDAKQYAQYSQERGQAAYAAIKDTMASASYKNASDENKAAMLKKALDAAYKQVSNQWKEKLGAYNK